MTYELWVPVGLSVLSIFLVPLIVNAVYSLYRRVPDETEHLLNLLEFLDEPYKPEEPEEPEEPEKPEEPKITPHGVRCEYCDSYVPTGTNCPNCGAVLPAQDEVLYVADGQEFTLTVDEVPPFVQFCRIAHDLGSVVTAPPLTQRR